MTNLKRAVFLIFIFSFFFMGKIVAQPAITVTGLKNTDWGQLINCNCTESLLLGDAGTGEVSIDAQKNNTIVVTINYPPDLLEDGGNDAIPYSTPLAAYNNSGTNDKSNATEFSGDQTTETITMPGGQGATSTIYIYIYGDITLNFPNAGTYSNTITVSAAYQ
jgi:hypothetical protein